MLFQRRVIEGPHCDNSVDVGDGGDDDDVVDDDVDGSNDGDDDKRG